MTIPLQSIPSFTAEEAFALAAQRYGVTGALAALPSERDQNFLVRADDRRWVLKIANAGDPSDLLELQNEAMRRVASLTECSVPRVMPTLDGLDIIASRNGRTSTEHCVRMLSWVDGAVLATSNSRSAALFESVGSHLAAIDRALEDFRHPAMHRVLQWDLRHAGLAREHVALLPKGRRAPVERAFDDWQHIAWESLRHSVIHGDANDHNMIVEGERMTGLLDFGDIAYSATVCDLAIGLAYIMLGETDPSIAAGAVARAFHRRYPLTSHEQNALLPLIRSRLSMSVCYAAHNRLRNPSDPYQTVTEAPAWNLLDRLHVDTIDLGFSP